MPLLIAAMWGALLNIAGTLVGRVLLSLGIGYVTYTGVHSTLDFARAAFLSGVSGVPAAALQIAGIMKVGVCVSMLLSAVAARLALAGMSAGGSITSMVVQK